MGWYSNIAGTAHHHDEGDDGYDDKVSNPDKWAHPPPRPRGDSMTDSGAEHRKKFNPGLDPLPRRKKLEKVQPE